MVRSTRSSVAGGRQQIHATAKSTRLAAANKQNASQKENQPRKSTAPVKRTTNNTVMKTPMRKRTRKEDEMTVEVRNKMIQFLFFKKKFKNQKIQKFEKKKIIHQHF